MAQFRFGVTLVERKFVVRLPSKLPMPGSGSFVGALQDSSGSLISRKKVRRRSQQHLIRVSRTDLGEGRTSHQAAKEHTHEAPQLASCDAGCAYCLSYAFLTAVIRWDEKAGLLYLLRFERVDNMGAYSIPPETGSSHPI